MAVFYACLHFGGMKSLFGIDIIRKYHGNLVCTTYFLLRHDGLRFLISLTDLHEDTTAAWFHCGVVKTLGIILITSDA
jgi:hypothetical protein